MRRTVSLVAVIGAMLPASPARAQTYDPAYPICLQVFGVQGGIPRMRLHVDEPMPALGLGPRGAMHRQSVFRTEREGAGPGTSPRLRTRRWVLISARAICIF